MAITESACVFAAVDTWSDEVLGVPKSKHFHGRHRSNGSPYWRNTKLWASEMILETLECTQDFMQAAKDLYPRARGHISRNDETNTVTLFG